MASLPHIQNIEAGVKGKSGEELRYDPMFSSIFEVVFDLPTALKGDKDIDAIIMSQQITEIGGLDALQKTTAAGSQKFLGVDVSFLNPTLDNTYADLTITFNLNIRDGYDAYILKWLKAWGNIGYNIQDGTRKRRKDYASANMTISEANRDGTIFRSYTFHNVMMTGLTGIDSLNYTANEARTIQATFRADWWTEDMGAEDDKVIWDSDSQ